MARRELLMAVDKLVDSAQLNADLTSVANAIRTKGGTSAQLAFPAGFVSAIDAIPTGGGGATVASGTVTLAASGNIVIPHNLDTTKVVCLISPTGTITATRGYTHMSLVAANLSAIFSDLDNVIYDFTSYASSNFPDPYHRNGPYPAGSGLKSPWSSHTPSQWDDLTGSSWAVNVAWPIASGADLCVTFNQNSVVATGFAIGTYNWKVVAL
jgi:hypothetical protein